MQKVAPVIADKLQAAEMALLDKIRDIGRWSIPTVLKELQMGRFHLLVAPWNLNGSEFVHGEAESRLLREFGELAALSRW